MIIIKISNNRLRFEHPIVLDPDKKYKLGVSHLMFSLDQTIFVNNFTFDFYVPSVAGYEDTVSCFIFGNFTIETLQKEIQDKINKWFDVLIKNYETQKKNDVKKLQEMPTTFKLSVKKETDKKYVMNITFPFKTTSPMMVTFAKFFISKTVYK
jgi:hypothetical protein